MNLNEIFNHALNSLTSPTKTANELVKKKLELGDGMLAVVLGALVPAVIGAVVLLVLGTWAWMFVSSMPMMGWTAMAGPAVATIVAISILIGLPIGALIGWFIATIIIWVVASALGGKGDYPKFATTLAFPMAAILALSWIPLLNILIALYGFYLLYVFLQPTMKMDSNKALLTVVALFIIWLVCSALFGGAAMWSLPPR
jgi:hypothetical protein